MLLDLALYLQQTRAEIERRRAQVALEKPPPMSPEERKAINNSARARRLRTDNHRIQDRAIRRYHRQMKWCSYTKCRGKNCDRGRT